MTTEEAARRLATFISGYTEEGKAAPAQKDEAATHKAVFDALMDFAKSCHRQPSLPPINTLRIGGG